jgi:putative serine/threonine protein kinase
MDELVTFDRLHQEGYGRVICYPRFDAEEFGRRLKEMRQLGVKALSFKGDKKVNNVPVLGKGCVGIVVLTHTEFDKVALKIRRTDADRTGMMHEAKLLRIANSVDVGPKLLGFTRNLLMLEFIDGISLSRWIETLQEGDEPRIKVRKVLTHILRQCCRLDEIGLDHGELSRAPKHIVIDAENAPYLLDFETASTNRKVSNVTSVCHYLFMRSKPAELIADRIGKINREDLLMTLRMYKEEPVRERFDSVLRACLL